MAPPVLRQSVSNAVCKGQSRTARATFTAPTIEKNLVIITAVSGGGPATTLTAPAGFVLIRDRTVGNLQVAMWYREGAPSYSAVEVTAGADRSLQIRAMEYSGAAQSGALDKVTVLTNSTADPETGSTGNIAQPDEVVVSVVANRYASTTQAAFAGGLTRLFESVSPQFFGLLGSNADADRTRLTVHELIANSVASFRLLCKLSSQRDWIAILCTFRGGSSGPKRMTSTLAQPAMTVSGSGTLSAFGKFKSTTAGPALSVSGSALMLPFAFQFRMNGLLLGQGTRYEVVSHDGLYGYEVRTSDDDQPRGDGAMRGVDLQSARQMLFKIEVDGSEAEVEQLLDTLYRRLTPQREVDWDLVWRHPAQVARMLRCRPIQLPREVDDTRTKLAPQQIALRAADPRHYAAVARRIEVPVTPKGAAFPLTVVARNVGNIPAHPRITIVGPTSGPPVSRVELVNMSGLVTFDVQLTLPSRGVLVGDMEARVTGAPRSVVTLDGQSKYGSWQLPRSPFRLEPDPFAENGDNVLYLRTEPPGAPVVCTLDYRDTWSG